MSDEPAPLPDRSWMLHTAGAALSLAAVLVAAGMFLGKLLGWHWFRIYRVLDTGLFLVASGLFLAGLVAIKPRPELRPKEEWPSRQALPEGEEPEEDEDPDALTEEELQRLEDLRARAPRVLLAGMVMFLSTVLLAQARFALGSLYGYREVPSHSQRQ